MYYLKNTNFWMFGLFFFFYFFIMGAYFPFFPIWLHDINGAAARQNHSGIKQHLALLF
ncbi:MFS transporter [Escherichia coli]|uniref:MFS transporter n=1 Tax=Escherichia coli TaxID=562 RepID=UPI000907736A